MTGAVESSRATPRKSKACMPCHKRKVRCDATQIGVPCSTCIARSNEQSCVMVERPHRARARPQTEVRVSQARPDTPTTTEESSRLSPRSKMPDSVTRLPSQTSGCSTNSQPLINRPQSQQFRSSDHMSDAPTFSHDQSALPPVPAAAQDQVTPFSTSEDDAHIQTLHRMTERDTTLNLSVAPGISQRPGGQPVLEYYDKLNSVSMLSEVLGRRRRKRLIQVDLPVERRSSLTQRGRYELEEADAAYLDSKGAFNHPPRNACIRMLQLWATYVYPYSPVVDLARFYTDFKQGICSNFLLFSVLGNAVPYASDELVQALGFPNRIAAQRAFVLRARLLHDFGCESQQFVLLQGSIVLSSFQYSFEHTKDSRFWFFNAIRLALQMGLHRKNLGEELDTKTYVLCRRIWWFLHSRDVLFSLSGFANARNINDDECDIPPPTVDDWVAEETLATASELGPITDLHKQFFVQNCRLGLLGARFLRMARANKSPMTIEAIQQFAQSLHSWREHLPSILQNDRVKVWSDETSWVFVLATLGYRLQSVFFRTAQEHLLQSGANENAQWCKKQLLGSIFELDILINRAVLHDIIRYAPSSIIICAVNLLAFQVEIALDPATSEAGQFMAKARIDALLAYLDDMRSTWQLATWTYRVANWVVGQAGLLLRHGQRSTIDTSASSPNASGDGAHPCVSNLSNTNMDAFDFAEIGGDNLLLENWISCFTGDVFFGHAEEESYDAFRAAYSIGLVHQQTPVSVIAEWLGLSNRRAAALRLLGVSSREVFGH